MWPVGQRRRVEVQLPVESWNVLSVENGKESRSVVPVSQAGSQARELLPVVAFFVAPIR